MATHEQVINDAADSLLEDMLEGNCRQIETAAKAAWELASDVGWSDATHAEQRQAVLITIEEVARRLKVVAYATGVVEASA